MNDRTSAPSPPPRRRVLLVSALLLAVAAVVGGYFWWRPVAPVAAAGSTPTDGGRARGREPVPLTVPDLLNPTAALPPPSSVVANGADAVSAATLSPARAAAQVYYANRRRAIHKLVVCAYGEEGERLDAMPFREAWPHVEEKALAGDHYAAQIMSSWGRACDELRQLGAAKFDRRMSLMVDDTLKGLDPVSAEFVSAAMRAEIADDRETLNECSAGISQARATDIMVQRAERIGTPPEVLARIRESGDYVTVPNLFDPKTNRMSECSDLFGYPDYWREGAFADAEGRQRWQRLVDAADAGSDLSLALRTCLDSGCTSLAQVPSEYQEALHDLVARLGNWRELSYSVPRTPTLTPVERYQRDLYARWLTQAGCDMLSSSEVFAQQTLQLIEQDRKLTADQRAAATANVRAQIQRYGAAALALRGCGT